MGQERTEAVVLRGVDFSETSRIVTLLSPTRGRLSCMAAGARRPKSPLAAVLDTFNRLEIVYYWKDSRSVQKLAETTLLDSYPGIKNNLEKAAYAAFPLEVAYKAAQENEPSQELYEALVRGLEGMALWQEEVKTHAAWQVVQLLSRAGYAPSTDCHGRPVGFAYDHGVVSDLRRADRRLSPREYQALCVMKEHPDKCPSVGAAGGVFEILRHFASRQLETEFRSLGVLDQLFGPKHNK